MKPPQRIIVFFVAASSIWCLLAEFYGLCTMRTFTIYILLPATAVLVAWAIFDRMRGDGALWRGFVIGSIAGFVAAIAYDLFRLPFVALNIMPLYKVFPRFGAMILGQPIEQSHYSLAAQLIGWTYHFSNGITFGIMYIALIGEARSRTWLWGIALAAGLELAMLFTPYPQFFGIPVTARFVALTMAAHIIFGAVMGLLSKSWAIRWNLNSLTSPLTNH